MQFFYSDNIDNDFIILEGEEMNHCTKSLRKKVGDLICVVDGSGGYYTCKIINIDFKICKLLIINKKIIEKKIKYIYLFHLQKIIKELNGCLKRLLK